MKNTKYIILLLSILANCCSSITHDTDNHQNQKIKSLLSPSDSNLSRNEVNTKDISSGVQAAAKKAKVKFYNFASKLDKLNIEIDNVLNVGGISTAKIKPHSNS